MKKSVVLRRSGLTIMAQLIILLGSLFWIMILAVINGTVGHFCAMLVAFWGAVGVAKALNEPIFLSYGWIIALALLSGILRGVLRYVEQYSNHYIAFRLLALLRDRIFSALRVLAPAKLENKKKGMLIAMITSDIETLEVFYAHTISPVLIAFFFSSGVFLLIGLVSSWYLALIALAGYLTLGIFLPILFSAKIKEAGVLYRKEFSGFNAFFLDSIKGIQEIVLNNGGAVRTSEVNRRSEILLKETQKIKAKSSTAQAITEFVVSFFILAAFVVGMLLVAEGSLSIGKMIMGVVALFGSFGPVLAISALPNNLTQTFASGDRLLDLLQERPMVEKIEEGAEFDFNHLKINRLSFSYEENLPVLKQISMEVQKGEIVGIIGESGCGKSTLLKLLLRFWKKESGSIFFEGDKEIDTIKSSSLLKNVTMVSQSTYLFNDTIEGNLRIAKPTASLQEMEKACELASIHDFICSLPKGYQTEVGQGGNLLSAGEKQRIGLARAFLAGSPLILLDEPTSNVDSINEGIILKALLNQKRKKGIILVSHRESTMAIADRIYKMENGKMKEI